MPNPLHASVLPVLRNLPSDFPRQPLLPGLKRRPVTPLPLLLVLAFIVVGVVLVAIESSRTKAAPPRAEADGRVTQVERIGSNVPANAQQNFIKYRFMVGDDLVYGSEIVEPSTTVPNVGDKIRISYAPATPNDNYRETEVGQKITMGTLNSYIAAIAITIFLILWMSFMVFLFSPVTPRDWLAWRRARGLYRNGELAAGRIQFVRNSSTFRPPNGNFVYEIVATYKVEGVRHLVTTRCDNAWLVNQLPPETQIVVAHDPLKPERAVILEPFAF